MAKVGAFELLRPLARGGQGQVWEARHGPTGHPAAVKLLLESSGVAVETFESEIAAIAVLDHPHIVRVLDAGRTPRGLEVPAGLPWLAMELLDGGTAHELGAEGMSWPMLRQLLRELLLALAHAHAHGLVHRDVKPANLLRDAGPYPAWKLADFGLSATRGGPLVAAATWGYAPPEQLGQADQGPWTDLFAAGAVGWRLATGAPPFRRGVERVLGRFEPRSPMPEGFEDWLRACLSDAPALRPVHAAVALDQLLELGHRREDPTEVVRMRGWRRPDAEPAALPLFGAGLGLFALRGRPLVGREPERDRLWSALERVIEGWQVVVLRGPRGAGARALARWVGVAASEAGLARRVALGEPEGGASLIDLVVRHREPREALLRDGLPAVVVEGVLRARDRELQPRDAQWLGPLLGVVQTPLVLDVSRAPAWAVAAVVDGLDLTDAPILVVGGFDDLELESDDALDAVVESLAELGSTLTLGPLSDAELDELTARLLPLEAGSAARLAAETGGWPGRLVGVLAQWVAQGCLELGPTGFLLTRNPRAEGDTSLRAQELLDGLGDTGVRAVWTLALLGPVTRESVWRAMCAVPTEVVSRLLRSGAVRAERSLTWTDPALREAVAATIPRAEKAALHGAIADLLLSLGSGPVGPHLLEAGRLREAAPRLLEEAEAARLAGDDALTMVRADQVLAAVEGTEDLARRADALRLRGWVLDNQGTAEAARRELREAVKLAERSGDPATAARCLRARASVLRRSGAVELALRCILAGRLWAEQAPEHLASLFFEQAMNHRTMGALVEAMAALHETLARVRESDALRADALMFLGITHMDLGHGAELSEGFVRQAGAVYEALGVRSGMAAVKDCLGSLARERGALEEAEALHREALALQASRVDRAVTKLNLGVLLCERSRWDEAISVMRESLQVFEVAERNRMAVFTHATLLWPLARRKKWRAFDHHLERARYLLGGRDVERDVILALEQAAVALGEGRRRDLVLELVSHQRSLLDPSEEPG